MTKNKIIITLHANGPSRASNANVPYTPAEIAAQSLDCWRAGASVVHWHATTETGAQSSDVALYAETVRRIKTQSDMITFPTLGAQAAPSEGRVSHIIELAKDPDTRPDCIPVDMLTTNLDSYDEANRRFTSQNRVYANTTETLMDIAARVRAAEVKPVPMFWNVAGVRVADKMIEMGVFERPLFCEVSVYGEPYLGFGHPATVKGVNSILDFFPENNDWRWTCSVIGANAFAVLANVMERGGDIAIGLHDYAYPELGFPSNVQLIERVADMARAMGREVATVAEARELLGMPQHQLA